MQIKIGKDQKSTENKKMGKRSTENKEEIKDNANDQENYQIVHMHQQLPTQTN